MTKEEKLEFDNFETLHGGAKGDLVETAASVKPKAKVLAKVETKVQAKVDEEE